MWLVAGLGNPGEKYSDTRHNAGFFFVDLYAELLAEKLRQNITWKTFKNYQAVEVTLQVLGKVLIVKPQTFMNRSGDVIGELVRFYKLPANKVLVVHDEVDLPLGTIRLKSGGGDGGHNGLKSVAACIGSADFIRLRIGVGRPPEIEGNKIDTADWVLGRFSANDKILLQPALDKALVGIGDLIKNGPVVAQNFINRD